jgi:diaminohydroxyphosphoribosylaminopyrimidine deaminase/5-amino-6-(5-phosphoribosylamino)uracil reductase
MVTERDAMSRAVGLALRGWGRVAPNPLVGAVVLRDGQIVGEGWHAEYGGPHAEVAALSRCDDPGGATMVVTLEPCNHQGKTPPCTEALLARGICRVVIAGRDPNAVAGAGADRLREAGVAVEIGVGAEEAAAGNAAYLWAMQREDRPFVAVKVAASLDGFIADAEGRSQWISGAEAHEYVHWLRAGFDAIGVGRETAVRDDPQLTVRGAVTPRVPPARVVFAGRGPLPSSLRCLDGDAGGPALVVTDPAVLAVRRAVLGPTGVRLLEAATPAAALRALRAAGVRALLVEGGGRLVGSLLQADLVDRVYRITAPLWLGAGAPAFGTRSGVALGDAVRWVVTERRALGSDNLLVVDRALCLPGS